MRRRITNEQAVELAKKKAGRYREGGTPEPILSAQESFKEAKAAIQNLASQVSNNVATGDEAILNACDVIIESMNLYHEAVMITLAGLPQPESIDMSQIDQINDRLITILTELMTPKPPKEWDFKVEYEDYSDKMVGVKATEIKH